VELRDGAPRLQTDATRHLLELQHVEAPRAALAESAGAKATVAYKFVSPEYFGTQLVLSQSFRPGLIIGGGAAAALAALLLAKPGAAPIGEIVHVLDPVAYIVSLLVIITACLAAASIPASRAGRLDPIQALRQD
jgi:hypothetical protein